MRDGKDKWGIVPNDPIIGKIGGTVIEKWNAICIEMMPFLTKKSEKNSTFEVIK